MKYCTECGKSMATAAEVCRVAYGFANCIKCAEAGEEGTRKRGFRDVDGNLHIVDKETYHKLVKQHNKRVKE